MSGTEVTINHSEAKNKVDSILSALRCSAVVHGRDDSVANYRDIPANFNNILSRGRYKLGISPIFFDYSSRKSNPNYQIHAR